MDAARGFATFARVLCVLPAATASVVCMCTCHPHPRTVHATPSDNPVGATLGHSLVMNSRRASLEGDDAGPSSVDPLLAELLAEATDDASPSGAGAAAPISLGEVSVTLMAMQGWCGE